jgi:5-methylcytosine-specific restriction enzyme subunit McrC
MLRTEHLTESRSTELELSQEEASTLAAIGRRLASDRAWFGDYVPEERTVIRCTPSSRGKWMVRVQDAVGVVSVGNDLQIVVRPKIPSPHLLYLFAKAIQVPRLDDHPAFAEAASALWELVARWFVRSAMALLRRDLSRDYYATDDILQMVRGCVKSVPTARAYYTGRIEVHCSFDEFVVDTPLNRLLRAAAREVSRSTLLTAEVRKDAARVVARFDDVGDFRQSDIAAAVERRTWYYRDAAVLARHILRCVGRTFAAGSETAWSFLIRTPELVEAGIRQTLIENLPHLRIGKFPAPIIGAAFGAHPDIVLGTGWAVADVKYKLNDGSWNRPDLYEVVAFASAFKCRDAALICFAEHSLATQAVEVGDITVSKLAWNCDLHPIAAGSELCGAFQHWTSGISNAVTPLTARVI